jgi:FtsH-binding integral membrane protein
MSRYEGYELDQRVSVASAAASERAAFIRRVYAHLAGSVLLLIGFCALLMESGLGLEYVRFVDSNSWMWLVALLVFVGTGYLAQYWAQSQTSPALQYLGLVLYIGVFALIFQPLLLYVSLVLNQPQMIAQAGLLTGAVFAGLTTSVFITRKDYSFLGPILCVGMWIAFGVIIAAILFGFSLGLFFCFAMVALMSGYILYDTSNVIHHYPTNMHVAAALQLFADVALLFLYILRILSILGGNRD